MIGDSKKQTDTYTVTMFLSFPSTATLGVSSLGGDQNNHQNHNHHHSIHHHHGNNVLGVSSGWKDI